MIKKRLRIALQKKGRLNSEGVDLLSRCGLKFRASDNSLVARVANLPIDILLVRDSDIPAMVMSGICDLGIVGENTLLEKQLAQQKSNDPSDFDLLFKLNFGHCRLSLAFSKEKNFDDLKKLAELRIATSYPHLLKQYLAKNNLKAEIFVISGSVEIAPQLSMADMICDLVSSGRTLEENHLQEGETLLQSQAVLIQSKKALSSDKEDTINLLLRRMEGVLQAKESKYILFHIDKSALPSIREILPGIESPTILPLSGSDQRVAVHLVSAEAVFWSTLEKLKAIGGSSILVLPIEKMMN